MKIVCILDSEARVAMSDVSIARTNQGHIARQIRIPRTRQHLLALIYYSLMSSKHALRNA